MIDISYCPEQNRLLMTGHACFAEPGKDTVCAAASMLAQTYASVCNSMDKAGWTTKPSVIDLQSGRARLKAFPRTNTCFVCRCKLDAIAEGFAILAKSYPDNIRFKID